MVRFCQNLWRRLVCSPGSLKHSNIATEFCRHKILDLIGDISLFGHPLIGHVVADRAGHAMHAQLVSQLLRQKECWTLTTNPSIHVGAPISATAEFATAGA